VESRLRVAVMCGDVPKVLEVGEVSEYRMKEKSHPEAVLYSFGLTSLGQLEHEAAAFSERMEVSFCSQWLNACISVCLLYHASLMADHWCKPASKSMARTCTTRSSSWMPPPCVAQDDCDEMSPRILT